MTTDQIETFNNLYKTATERVDKIIVLGNYRVRRVGFFDKRNLKKSIKDYEQCLRMAPGHWQSMLFMAKSHQRLGDHEAALLWLEKAMQIETTSHTIPQEASIEAVHLNNIDKGILFSAEAIRRKPNDFALLGNHAMNLLIAGRDDDAKRTVELAIELNPSDTVNKNILKQITDVTSGRKKRPTCKDIVG